MNEKIRYILGFLTFFGLFYSENFSIGSISISQLWKIPLVLYMLYTLYINREKIFSSKIKYRNIAFLQAIQKFFNADILITPIQCGILVTKYLNFPLLLCSIPIWLKGKSKTINFLVRFCQYGILSYIPFLLNILNEPREAYGAEEILQFKNAVASHVGLFQNPHGASAFLSISFIVILYYIKTHKLNKLSLIYNYILLTLGAYCLYVTYVRTGYVMFIIGILVFVWPTKVTLRHIVLFFTTIICCTSIFFFLLNTNDYFKMRVLDLNEYGKEKKTKGSGRLIFAHNGIHLWLYDSNIYTYIMGHGQEAVKDNNAKMLNNPKARIYSHNGYVDALAQNGIIGLLLMLGLYYYMFTRIRQIKRTSSYRLGLSWLSMQLIFQLFQGGVGFITDLISALILIIIEYDRKKILQHIIYRKEISSR